MKCLWCGKLFDVIIASCGTGSTWSLFECPHCENLMASGNIIPIEVKKDPEIRIGGECSSRPLLAIGYEAPLHRVNKSTGFVTMPIIKGGKMRTTNKKRIKAIEDKMKNSGTRLIPASKIFAEFPYYGENVVVGGNSINLQTLLTLLMDELGLKIVTTPASTKLEKKGQKNKGG